MQKALYPGANPFRTHAGFTQRPQAQRIVPLGETQPVLVAQQLGMKVARFRQS